MVDLLIAGAGPVGCVVAEQAAKKLGWHCLIVEKRHHIAGNCFDRYWDNGVLVHQYGPHAFRTDNEAIYQYLSQFTDWIPGNHIVKVRYKGQLYPFPINLDTLEKFYHRTFTAEEARAFLEEKREHIEHPDNSEAYVLSRVGRELYEAFYLGYTLKHWNVYPRDLAPSVCGRIPLRFDRFPYYNNCKYRVMPDKGFTALFERMIDHPKIEVRLNTDYFEMRDTLKPRYASVYCGPIDRYFNYKLGRLPWRSIDFEFKAYEMEYKQSCSQINYPDNYDYTRSFEYKHITGQHHPETVLTYDFPKSTGDPYYPVPNPDNATLYKRYKELARQETEENRVYFYGRLAQYVYIDTDKAIELGFRAFDTLKGLKESPVHG